MSCPTCHASHWCNCAPLPKITDYEDFTCEECLEKDALIAKLKTVVDAARKFREEMNSYSTGISCLSEEKMSLLDTELQDTLNSLKEMK